ncbi:hypothetical protein Q7P36_005911 [Cladosporium allicinum]
MRNMIRDTLLGQAVRLLTRKRYLLYPDERPDHLSRSDPVENANRGSGEMLEAQDGVLGEPVNSTNTEIENTDYLSQSNWCDPKDQENPRNWTGAYKGFVTLQICVYTFVIYMGSAIYVPSTTGVMYQFGISVEVASLGLSLYVLGYGTGTMLFSPLSEIPSLGRTSLYASTMFLFVLLLIPTALAENVAGLLVLRFLLGFLGSPALATGPASLADMYSDYHLAYAIGLWVFAASSGPAFGPTISGFVVPALGWKWSIWEMLWFSGPVLILMAAFLPETSASNILLRRAQRLQSASRKNRACTSPGIAIPKRSLRIIAFEALVRPMQLLVMDFAIGYIALYTALIYSTYYTFFEVFPLVYVDLYGFTTGQLGLTFLSITVAGLIAMSIYFAYLHWLVKPFLASGKPIDPEQCLLPALFFSFLLPVGLFIFAWTSDGHIHWIVGIIGITIYSAGMYITSMSIFTYLPRIHPEFTASTFAGNNLIRSTFAAAGIILARPMYRTLGIAKGTSVLGALTAACTVGIYVLFLYGKALRARSRFSSR